MIVISKEHKETISKILKNYSEQDFKKKLDEMTPILESYCSVKPLSISKRLLHSLFSSWMNKTEEAIVHYWTICKLIHEYAFSPEYLDYEVSCGGLGREALLSDKKADIVVYSHESRRPGTALIAIECRAFQGIDGAKQAASYSRALQSRYHLFTDSNRWQAYETQPHPIDGISISDIPKWVGYKPLAQRMSKNHILPPITDEKQLRDLVSICHNSIHSEGVDPAKAFDELVKLLFVKIYDEQEIPNVYEFSVLSGESVKDTGEHIRNLLKQAKQNSMYKELFFEPGDDEFYVSNQSIRTVVETFQGFSFTGKSLTGIDSKGTVYENMVGSTFRGELGQYFTPRKIVEFMVSLLDPVKTDIVWDPSCGSGGFLIYALRRVATKTRIEQPNLLTHQIENLIKNFANNNLYGSDLSPRMVRASRMNMIMHGDGWSGIHRCHGLKIQDDLFFSKIAKKITLVLSNPPFAGHESHSEILQGFSVGKNDKGKIRSVNRAIIFVEQIINMLGEGGRAGLVLPRSIFENESHSFQKIRKLIFEKCEIIAIVGLPKTAFHHTDCGILGDLLFIKKIKEPRKNYNVFVGHANDIGYNTLGHNIEENDFPPILQKFKNEDSDHQISIKTLKEENNINPWHYHPQAKKIREEIESNKSRLVKLSKLVSVYNNRISRKNMREIPTQILRYAEVRDFDVDTNKFTYKKHKIGTLPSRATYELNGEELILLPNARNSLESKRKVIKIGDETKGIILTNRFLPLRPNVNVDFLVMMLNHEIVREQLIAACRGAGSPDFREGKLAEIMIPVPNSEDLSSIDSFMEKVADNLIEIAELQEKVIEIQAENSNLINSLYNS